MFIKKIEYAELVRLSDRARQMQNENYNEKNRNSQAEFYLKMRVNDLTSELCRIKALEESERKQSLEKELKEEHKYALMCLEKAKQCVDANQPNEAHVFMKEYEEYVNYKYQEEKEN